MKCGVNLNKLRQKLQNVIDDKDDTIASDVVKISDLDTNLSVIQASLDTANKNLVAEKAEH